MSVNICVYIACAKYARTSKAYAYPCLKTSVVVNNWCVFFLKE